jgi:N-acyl-D-amino-acid deacylase
MPFDLLIRGGLLVDGTGAAGRLADVGVLGDRILATGNLSAVAPSDIRLVVDASGLVVAPGFIDPHGHSDGSLFVDGALASHLRQGFTTQVSGNCGSPARQMGLRDRGIAREGAIADLVVIDPATVADTATDEVPARYPLGIEHVIVNGVAAVLGGAETGELAGRLIRGGG